jgi:ectoine hydroxylase-related dioxygenase (phytanoyl-CoA dioxygenase family)
VGTLHGGHDGHGRHDTEISPRRGQRADRAQNRYLARMRTDDREERGYYSVAEVSIDQLSQLVDTRTDGATYPTSSAVVNGVVVYDADRLTNAASSRSGRVAVLGEIAHVLRDGPGVLCIRNAVSRAPLERATVAFEAMIRAQHVAGTAAGDHFAKAGANDRVWNALEKLCIEAPDAFADYYESDALALASLAWLGPGYQMTSQLNMVRPTGKAQSPHRDYPLGFLSDDQAEEYPGHTHTMSPFLTLQGAVAHVDMPIESGPTKLLPHSQRLADGYLAWRRSDVMELFERRFVQLSLCAGDAVFFNPALLHAAGDNHTTEVQRLANLLQVVSPFARAMESIDRRRMCAAIFPTLRTRLDLGWSDGSIRRVIAATAEGYPFPTNLDRDPPIGGLAPPSQADLVWNALQDSWTSEQLEAALDEHAQRRGTH